MILYTRLKDHGGHQEDYCIHQEDHGSNQEDHGGHHEVHGCSQEDHGGHQEDHGSLSRKHGHIIHISLNICNNANSINLQETFCPS